MVLAYVHLLSPVCTVHVYRCTVRKGTSIIQCSFAVLSTKEALTKLPEKRFTLGSIFFSINCCQEVCNYYISYFLLFTWNKDYYSSFLLQKAKYIQENEGTDSFTTSFTD